MLRGDIMRLNHDFQLIQPLIHFSPYQDENPISYLIRLKDANICNTISWLIYSVQGRNFPVTYIRAFNLLKTTAWLNYHYLEEVDVIINFPYSLVNRQKVRFCPECLQEANYYRMGWQRKATLVCLKHQKYLQDSCKECFSDTSLHKGAVGYCTCGNDLSTQSNIRMDKSAIDLQLFVEGELPLFSEAFLGQDLSQLSLQERNEFIVKLSEWQLDALIYKDENRKKKPLTMEALKFVAKTFFGHKQSFLDYLLALSHLEINKLPVGIDNVFVSFYRFFYRNFKSGVFAVYKQWIESFILEKWDKPISHRNSFFSKKLVKNYPWITIDRASKAMRVAPSDLYKAIKDGRLLSVTFQKSQNAYTLVYRPNLFVLEEYLTQIASFTRAQAMLKITKKQLYELLESNFFPEASSPQENNRGVWIIPKEQIASLIAEFYSIKDRDSLGGITLGQAMRVICGRIPTAFVSLLTAIRKKEVKIYYYPSRAVLKRIEKDSLQSFTICQDSLERWVAKQIKMPGYFTIPEFAAYWNIHQEFAYQLVNMGLIGHEVKGRTRYITDMHMNDFKAEYAISTHIFRKIGNRAKEFRLFLDKEKITSIDASWDKKLRQTVYRRKDLERFFEEWNLSNNRYF